MCFGERTRAPAALLALELVCLWVCTSVALGAAFHPTPGGSALASGTNAAEAFRKASLSVVRTGSNTYRIGHVRFDSAQHTVSVPARVRVRNFVVEYGLVTEEGKAYESVLTTEARAVDIHLACLLLGQGQGSVTGEFGQAIKPATTNAVILEVTWNTNGKPVRVAFSRLVCLTSGQPGPAAPPMAVKRWLYNGSLVDAAGFAAQREGSIISLIRDPVALVNNPGADRDNDDIHFPNKKLLPPEGTAVTVLIRCLGTTRKN